MSNNQLSKLSIITLVVFIAGYVCFVGYGFLELIAIGGNRGASTPGIGHWLLLVGILSIVFIPIVFIKLIKQEKYILSYTIAILPYLVVLLIIVKTNDEIDRINNLKAELTSQLQIINLAHKALLDGNDNEIGLAVSYSVVSPANKISIKHNAENNENIYCTIDQGQRTLKFNETLDFILLQQGKSNSIKALSNWNSVDISNGENVFTAWFIPMGCAETVNNRISSFKVGPTSRIGGVSQINTSISLLAKDDRVYGSISTGKVMQVKISDLDTWRKNLNCPRTKVLCDELTKYYR